MRKEIDHKFSPIRIEKKSKINPKDHIIFNYQKPTALTNVRLAAQNIKVRHSQYLPKIKSYKLDTDMSDNNTT